MRIISKIKKTGFAPLLYKIWTRVVHYDRDLDSLCDQVGAYRYLKRYEKVLNDASYGTITESFKSLPRDSKVPRIVWICWLQGYENAPGIIKACRDSVYRNFASDEWRIVEVSEQNVGNYIDVPTFITERRKSGAMSRTFYSDWIRMSLLAKYGGIWLDSTIMLSGSLPKYMTDAPMFVFKTRPIGYGCCTQWFIATMPNNPIIIELRDFIETYWRHENRLISYAIMGLMWRMIVNHDHRVAEIMDSVPYFDQINCQMLAMELSKPYSDERERQIYSMSPVHKLTWKSSDNERVIGRGTFLSHILNHYGQHDEG